MKLFDLQCANCDAVHRVAEAESVGGNVMMLSCSVCRANLAAFDDGRARVSRLVAEGKPARFFAPPIAP